MEERLRDLIAELDEVCLILLHSHTKDRTPIHGGVSPRDLTRRAKRLAMEAGRTRDAVHAYLEDLATFTNGSEGAAVSPGQSDEPEGGDFW